MTTRIYIDEKLELNKIIRLPKDKQHYIFDVLRLNKKVSKISISLFNGSDGEWECEISGKNLICTKKIFDPPVLNSSPVLIFPIIKRADILVEKATELGVSVLQPMITARTNIRTFNNQRFQSIAISASQQCGRIQIPIIKEPLSLCDIIATYGGQTITIADETKSGVSLKSSVDLDNMDVLMIGPEGGFSDDELSIIRNSQGFRSISLGHNILRSETAAIVILTLYLLSKSNAS